VSTRQNNGISIFMVKFFKAYHAMKGKGCVSAHFFCCALVQVRIGKEVDRVEAAMVIVASRVCCVVYPEFHPKIDLLCYLLPTVLSRIFSFSVFSPSCRLSIQSVRTTPTSSFYYGHEEQRWMECLQLACCCLLSTRSISTSSRDPLAFDPLVAPIY